MNVGGGPNHINSKTDALGVSDSLSQLKINILMTLQVWFSPYDNRSIKSNKLYIDQFHYLCLVDT